MNEVLPIDITKMQSKNQDKTSNLLRCGSSSLNKRRYYSILTVEA